MLQQSIFSNKCNISLWFQGDGGGRMLECNVQGNVEDRYLKAYQQKMSEVGGIFNDFDPIKTLAVSCFRPYCMGCFLFLIQ
jgi:hypothetical protein